MTAPDFDIECFQSGLHKGEFWSTDDLDECVDNYRLLDGRVPVRIKIGHDDRQVLNEDLGHIAALWRVGTKLKATIRGMPQRLYELLQKGVYRRCSAEIYPRFEKSTMGRQLEGAVRGKALTAIALLGCDVPEVKSLNDLVAPLRAHDGDLVLHMNESELLLAEREDTMERLTFTEERRGFWRWLEDNPQLFDGSEHAYFSTTSIDVSEWEFLQAGLRDACEYAARGIANQNGLDFRRIEDRQEAYRLLYREDPSWSAASFDEMSAPAQTQLINALHRMKARIGKSHYGRPGLGYQPAHTMLDQHHQARMERMIAVAKRDGIDLSTTDGKRYAYQKVCDESPHLKVPAGRGRTNAVDTRHPGVLPVAGGKMDDQFDDVFDDTFSGRYKLRRGAPPTGEPSSPPGTNPFATARPFPPTPHSEGTDGTGGLGGKIY
jgi:hypothetical protein